MTTPVRRTRSRLHISGLEMSMEYLVGHDGTKKRDSTAVSILDISKVGLGWWTICISIM
jgi:hypothetical protein